MENLSVESIRSKRYTEVANFFVGAFPENGTENAIEFLESVVLSLKPTSKRARVEAADQVVVKNETSGSYSVSWGFLLHDAVESSPITLVVQVPEDSLLISVIIGQKGSHISRVSSESGARVQVERVGFRPADSNRHIIFTGSIITVLKAYELMISSVAKLPHPPAASAAITELTKLVVPNEVVAHIIGKGGSLIKELTAITSVQRIDIQQERDMKRPGSTYYGRTMNILGAFGPRVHAIYLLLRQMVQDRSFSASWKGENPPVLHGDMPNMQGHGMPPMQGHGMPPMLAAPVAPGATTNQLAAALLPLQNLLMQQAPVPQRAGPPGGAGGEPVSVALNVPADKFCVGAVIGPQGRSVSEIQSLSGCHIQFTKVPDGQQVAERVVNITGPSEAHTNRAVELIRAKVDEWRRNSQGLGQQQGLGQGLGPGFQSTVYLPPGHATPMGTIPPQAVNQLYHQQHYGQQQQQPPPPTGFGNRQY